MSLFKHNLMYSHCIVFYFRLLLNIDDRQYGFQEKELSLCQSEYYVPQVYGFGRPMSCVRSRKQNEGIGVFRRGFRVQTLGKESVPVVKVYIFIKICPKSI